MPPTRVNIFGHHSPPDSREFRLPPVHLTPFAPRVVRTTPGISCERPICSALVSFIPLLGGLDQHANLRDGVVKDVPWNALDPFCTSNLPVETLDLVR